MTTTTEATAMNKVQIIAELENMVAARLFGPQPCLQIGKHALPSFGSSYKWA